jgi:hypothetical protein
MMVVLGVALGTFVGYAYKDNIADFVNRVAELATHEEIVVIHKDTTGHIDLTFDEAERSTLIEEYFNEKEVEYIYGMLDNEEIVNFYTMGKDGSVDWLVSCYTEQGVEWSIRDAQQNGDRLVVSYD